MEGAVEGAGEHKASGALGHAHSSDDAMTECASPLVWPAELAESKITVRANMFRHMKDTIVRGSVTMMVPARTLPASKLRVQQLAVEVDFNPHRETATPQTRLVEMG